MEALLISTGLVTLAEMGDKTQLLSLVLAARYKRPWTIALGILIATLANHGLAGALGAWIAGLLGPEVLRWGLGFSFLAMAVWMLIPDRLDEGEGGAGPRFGVLLTTVVVFFLAEMGDKTQLATVMLAARYDALAQVVLGTTLGMMLANVPVVWMGERLTRRLPIALVHRISALIFAVLGLLVLALPSFKGPV
jgi:Ca2+/H+ antiporter, TMEM165/GDT1 family